MQPSSSMKLALRGLTLTVLLGCLWLAADLREARGDDPVCDPYDEYVCSTTGHYMNSDCTCNYNVCINLVQADCSEQGKELNLATCTCVDYNLYCQNFDEVIRCIQRGGSLNESTCQCSPASAAQLYCSNAQIWFCQSWGGTLDNQTCLCRFTTGSGCTASQAVKDACTSNYGIWDNYYCYCRMPS